ncbi:MAG: hypothetical protein RLZZ426_582 [Actinomycetota bacterium]|jgi:uncharacterized repeat protein (TIGR02543 family)
MKIKNKFLTLALSIAVAASGFIATAAPAQATEFDVTGLVFDFKNESGDIGEDAIAGFTHRYSDVVNVGGQAIDAILTVVSVEGLDWDYEYSNGADNRMGYVDGSLEDSIEDVIINTQFIIMEDASPFGQVSYRLEFVLGGTSTPATLTNVHLYVDDIDSYQFADFSTPTSYELASNTNLRALTHADDSTIANGTYRFYDWDRSKASKEDEENWASVSYDSVSTIDISLGAFAYGGSGFAIDFARAIFDSSVVTTTEPNVYNISYDGNNQSSGNVAEDTVGSGNLVVDNNSGGLVRAGYAFAGWNTEADGTGISIEAGATYLPTKNITLYATWVVVPQTPIKMTKIIYFNSASGKITPAALRQLRAFVNSVKGIDVVSDISIYGYVQPTANNKADKALSTARAKNTASALKKLGIGKINDAVGMGKAINKSAAASRYVRIVVRGYNEVQPG